MRFVSEQVAGFTGGLTKISTKPKHSTILKLVLANFCFVMLAASTSQAIAGERPNIVMFFIDDLGWTDVGYMYDYLGGPTASTKRRTSIAWLSRA